MFVKMIGILQTYKEFTLLFNSAKIASSKLTSIQNTDWRMIMFISRSEHKF